jgi:hypothetical protein
LSADGAPQLKANVMLVLLWQGTTQMKKVISVLGLIIVFTLTGQSAYGCSCSKMTGVVVDANGNQPRPDSEEFKKWLGEYKGALFIGRVVKIENVKVKEFNERVPMKRVTVKVEKYWAGVGNPAMIIYTGIGGGDCGVPYVKGERYFFWAAPVGGLLETGICSPRSVNNEVVDSLDGVFGKAKEFPLSEPDA